MEDVSIPYERESTSELFRSGIETKPIGRTVSIPYERESTSELKSWVVCGYLRLEVSIPYERESTSERAESPERQKSSLLHGFNSLRTGKHFWTGHPSFTWEMRENSFNSLRTGKHFWTKEFKVKVNEEAHVSIPYERESTSEHP